MKTFLPVLCLLLTSFQVAPLAEVDFVEVPVMVVGGGTSGVMAAIQSARMGVKTVLVEEGPWLGGMLTAAGVSAIDGNHELPSGLWGEFRAELENHYGGAKELATGWVSNTQFEPSVGAKILREMAAKEKNLLVLLETRRTEVMQTTRGWIVTLLDKTGHKTYVKSPVLVDATELGDVAAKAVGIRYDVGMDSRDSTGEAAAPPKANDIVQDLTYAAILKDYGPDSVHLLPRPPGYNRNQFLCACRKLCPDTTRPRLHDCDKMLSYARLPNDKYLINWPVQGNDFYANLIEASPEGRKMMLDEAKRHTLRFVYFIQNDLGYRNLGLADDEFPTDDRLPLIAYHRESRRIRGLARLTMNHIEKPFSQQEKYYRTGIAVGDYPIDHHHGKYPAGVPDLHFVPVPSYNVPLGSLIPQGVDHLIVAEKSISVTNLANGTTRLQPVVMGIGQAAGALAALAAKKKVSPHQVPIRDVQDALLNATAYLMPYTDVKPDHPDWASIQRIGATGMLKGVPTPHAWANQTWFYPDSTIRVSEFLKGWGEFFPEMPNPLPPSQARMTVREAHVVVDAVKREPWYSFAMSIFRRKPIPEDRPITRAELARLFDEQLDPFHQRAVDFDGNFVRRNAPLSAKSQK